MAQLSHSNILNTFDFGRVGATAYAAMKLLEGETLRERMARRSDPTRSWLCSRPGIRDSHSPSPARAFSIARRAGRDSRRSTLTRQTQALGPARQADMPEVVSPVPRI